MTWLAQPGGRTLAAASGKHKATAQVEELEVNSQLSYCLAQAHQQELRRAAEQARGAHELSGPSRLSVLWHRIASLRSIHLQPQAPSPAQRPVAGGVNQI